MTLVYCVFSRESDDYDRWLSGVFSTRQKADVLVADLLKANPLGRFSVDVVEVDYYTNVMDRFEAFKATMQVADQLEVK